jgi:hypothetical protein
MRSTIRHPKWGTSPMAKRPANAHPMVKDPPAKVRNLARTPAGANSDTRVMIKGIAPPIPIPERKRSKQKIPKLGAK